MKIPTFAPATLLLSLAFTLPAHSQSEVEWVSLFNGKDLSNWVNVNCAPETWSVKDGVIQCTGRPTGALRTPKMYENFILEVEWRHLKSGGNAGIFIWSSPLAAPGVPFLRSIEVQVLDHGYGNTDSYTTHGDVFPIHGSSMNPFGRSRGQRSFPSELRSKPAPEWNHYRIEARDGVLKLSVNGKEVSGGENCVWRKGYLGLESEGAPTEWRVVKIQELPPGKATPEQTADETKGHRPLYTGIDLRGWKGSVERWQVADNRLVQKKGTAGDPLWTEAEWGDCELVLDCKIGQLAPDQKPGIKLGGPGGLIAPLPVSGPGKWERFTITRKGREITVSGPAGQPTSLTLPESAPARGSVGLIDLGGNVEWMNLYGRDL